MWSVFFCILSGGLLILAFPKPDLGFLAWIALVPWFFALRREQPRRAFLLSYLVGLVFFSGVLYWVTYVSTLGFIILVFYLALYFAIFGLFFCVQRLTSSIQLFILPCIWVSLEYLRSHLFTGFGWALLGYSQYRYLPIIQISDITGGYGVSFLIVLVNMGIWQGMEIILEVKGKRLKVKGEKNLFLKGSLSIILCVLFTVILALGYGYFRLNQKLEGENLKVSVVQGNIPQERKWDPQARDYILERYADLTKQASLRHPDIIIWPETSVPGFLQDDPELLKKITDLSRKVSPAYLLVGTPQQGEEQKIYNSASLLFQKEIIQRYDKLHLVPFGEFTPLPEFFSRFAFAGLIGNFSPGKDYTVFNLNPGAKAKSAVKFSALICFEDVFGQLARRFVQKGARILVNMTNDAWFRDSSEPGQHLQASVFRAVENRVNLVRSANTGISCFISPWGEILSRVVDDSGKDLLLAGEKTEDLKIASISSFYTTFGDIFAWICLMISLIFAFRQRWLSNKSNPLTRCAL